MCDCGVSCAALRSSTLTNFSAGIIGLYTAYALIEKGIAAKDIKVVAEHLPGDTSTKYTSPWAGGNFSCISPDDDATLFYDKFTYTHLQKLRSQVGQCGLEKLPTTEYWDYVPSQAKINSLKEYLEDFAVIPAAELHGKAFGVKYITWNFNCPEFLCTLKQYLTRMGVCFVQKKLSTVLEASTENTVVTFNCSGIGAHDLVNDKNVYPVRGQVLVTHAPHIKENRMFWGKNHATYIIPRPDSNGQVILGGFVQADNWSGDTYAYDTKDILQRTSELFPQTSSATIVTVAAGLRPYRKGGVRIEKQRIGSQTVIHNYGAGGYGYQAGWGMAEEATNLFLSSRSKL